MSTWPRRKSHKKRKQMRRSIFLVCNELRHTWCLAISISMALGSELTGRCVSRVVCVWLSQACSSDRACWNWPRASRAASSLCCGGRKTEKFVLKNRNSNIWTVMKSSCQIHAILQNANKDQHRQLPRETVGWELEVSYRITSPWNSFCFSVLLRDNSVTQSSATPMPRVVSLPVFGWFYLPGCPRDVGAQSTAPGSCPCLSDLTPSSTAAPPGGTASPCRFAAGKPPPCTAAQGEWRDERRRELERKERYKYEPYKNNSINLHV